MTSEPKVPRTPSAESPTKSREAPVPGNTASGKRDDLQHATQAISKVTADKELSFFSPRYD